MITEHLPPSLWAAINASLRQTPTYSLLGATLTLVSPQGLKPYRITASTPTHYLLEAPCGSTCRLPKATARNIYQNQQQPTGA
jgi:hypothetical protein